MAYSSDIGFDRESLRRQFRLSLGLVVAMMLAAFALGVALPIGPATPSIAIDEAGVILGRLVSIID